MKITLKNPKNNATVSQLSELHKNFIKTGGNKKSGITFDFLNLVKQGEDHAYGEPVILEWDSEKEGKFFVFLSESKDFSNSKIYEADQNKLDIYNLCINRTYFWKVCDENSASEVFSFKTEATAPRWIKAGGLSNIRDMGGWQTENGAEIKQGLIFRGCEFEFHHIITDEGKKVLNNELKIKTDLDLREEAIGKIEKSALGDHVNYHLIPLRAYAEFFTYKEQFRDIMKLFTDEKNYPIYYHCWGGADRTGTVAFFLGAIFGMSLNDLCLDYELTSFSIWGERSTISELFTDFLKELDKYGNKEDTIKTKCENYLNSIGITNEDIDKIKKINLKTAD